MFKPLFIYSIKTGPIHKRLKLRYREHSRNYSAHCGAPLFWSKEFFVKYIDRSGKVILSNGFTDKEYNLTYKEKRSY